MRSTINIQLPVERGLQLQALGQKRQLKITETIEELLERAIVEGEIEDRLPGLNVQPSLGKVVFSAPTFQLMPVTPAHAREIAHYLEVVVKRETTGGKVLMFNPAGDVLKIMRIGRGITLDLANPNTGHDGKYSITPRMGLALARHFRKAADAAEMTR